MTNLPEGHLLSVLNVLTQSDLSPRLRGPVEELRSLLVPEIRPSQPFLTVLLRTQGQRIEALRDALLCLSAQTDQDFEVIVIDHDSDEVGKEAVSTAVSCQRPDFRARVQIVEVSGGNRAAPLNAGVRLATGRYLAVFDDDDLLFGDWVERFHEAEELADGRMIRAQTAVQHASLEKWRGDLSGYRSTSWPTADYAPSFNQLDHLLVNHSPFMSLAFPLPLFSELGLRFDEDLLVCEDWDMILRGSLLLGVVDAPAMTSIYRRWHNIESSYTQHSGEEWQRAEATVIDRLDSMSVVLPPGTVSRLKSLVQSEEASHRLESVLNSSSWRATAPLRGVSAFGTRARRSLKARLARIIRPR